MNVKELRSMMESALKQEGLEAKEVFPKAPKAWSLDADDIVRFFQPHAIRCPWGFDYSGFIGIEIPALRQWLRANAPCEEGIFHSCFVGYVINNDDAFRDFKVAHGQPVPTDLWAGLVRDRLERIPATVSDLVATYRRNRELLGWLAHPLFRHAWQFLLEWHDDPNRALSVPMRQSDGRIS